MRTEASDEELWRRAAAHDGAAFGDLFDRHANAVYNHCFRRTASWSRAEELTSIVFMEVWRKRRSVDLHGETLLPWFLAVANNVIRNADRAGRRHRRLLAKLPKPMSSGDFGDDSAARADDERQAAALLDVLRSLRTEEQEVVHLCDWSGLSQADAARALGIPAGTVRSRLARAHEHMRARLTSGHFDSSELLWTTGESQ